MRDLLGPTAGRALQGLPGESCPPHARLGATRSTRGAVVTATGPRGQLCSWTPRLAGPHLHPGPPGLKLSAPTGLSPLLAISHPLPSLTPPQVPLWQQESPPPVLTHLTLTWHLCGGKWNTGGNWCLFSPPVYTA